MLKNTKKKILTRLIGYSSLAFSGLMVSPAIAADLNSKPAAITLAAVTTPAVGTSQNAKVLLAMANQYRVGNGVSPNQLRAFEYYKRAASMGLAEAQFQLAAMYLESDAIKQNEDEALKWLERADVQGHKKARFTYNFLLNNTYYDGC